ncbi:MAG TPA: protein kinase [Pyrinomonadaceae bacterium]|nr:protein kinase [Pyrinomonadaceae bacterium]
MSLPPGTRLGRYQIRSRLGAGGMGEVYIAEDTLLRRPAAVKVLTGDFTHSEERLHRFEREAYAASSLNHPNIVTIYEIGSEGDLHYIATEYVEGESLREHIRFTRMELREILDFAIQIASALAVAHQAGIIHRDIKPENIMLRQDGYVKILDFGLAKLADDAEFEITDTEAPTQVLLKTEPGRVMGTINYMSPEQARGLEVDSRTDIFSLGVILYEMVAGTRPFAGDTKSDVLAAVLMLEPPPLAKYFPEVPAELNRITSKALRKNPEERYQTAKEMLIDLRSLKQELDFEAKTGQPILRVPGDLKPAVATAADVGGSVSTARQTEAIPTISELFINEVKRHPRRMTLTFSVVALLIAAGGWGLYRLIWLPDGSGLLLAARDLETRLSQIWVFTYPEGKLSRMTNDLSSYYGLSMTADAKTLASVQGDRQSNIWVVPEGNSDLAQRITFEAGKDEGLSGLSWTPDGRIVYSSRATGTADLWIVNEDGSNNHQLTFDARANFFPSVSPDGRYIVFVSDRTGNSEIWRMNLDGTGARQLTTTLGTAGKPRCSPDSKWIVYELTTDQKTTLWKVGIDGATPVQSLRT